MGGRAHRRRARFRKGEGVQGKVGALACRSQLLGQGHRRGQRPLTAAWKDARAADTAVTTLFSDEEHVWARRHAAGTIGLIKLTLLEKMRAAHKESARHMVSQDQGVQRLDVSSAVRGASVKYPTAPAPRLPHATEADCRRIGHNSLSWV